MLVRASDEELAKAGIPLRKKDVQRYFYYKKMPGVIVKIGGKLYVDSKEFDAYVEEQKKKERETARRLYAKVYS